MSLKQILSTLPDRPLAAKLQRIPAYIVIPNVKCYGGHIIFNEATIKSRQETKKRYYVKLELFLFLCLMMLVSLGIYYLFNLFSV
uniref:Uncharacterized protein n=1 Tax=Helianthus annuus TaxID=4232 RepID=A0A251S5W8_HELAN